MFTGLEKTIESRIVNTFWFRSRPLIPDDFSSSEVGDARIIYYASKLSIRVADYGDTRSFVAFFPSNTVYGFTNGRYGANEIPRIIFGTHTNKTRCINTSTTRARFINTLVRAGY